MFSLLESTMRELKEENKQLRSEVKQLSETVSKQKSPTAQTTAPQPQPVQNNNNCDDIKERIKTEVETKVISILEKMESNQREAKVTQETIESQVEALKTSQVQFENTTKQKLKTLEESLASNTPLPVPASNGNSSPDTTNMSAPTEDVDDLKLFVLQTVEATKDLVRGPLSVVFDAVRSEDFVGEDSFLTFSKVCHTCNIYFMVQKLLCLDQHQPL